MSNTSMNDMSGFVVVAATLMLIKSMTLLPNLAVTSEEKGEIEVLEKRLEVFQIVKAISGFVREQYGKTILYRRPFVRVKKKVFNPDPQMTAEILMNQAIYALEHIPKEYKAPEVKQKRAIQIEEILSSLLLRVQKEARFRFSDFTKSGTEALATAKEVKTFLVVTFLAVLEMVKNGTLEANQDSEFGDITLESQQV
jgi:segregation and condensation protein A